jgi:hypothetical protein
VAKTAVKRLLCCRFRRTGKALGQDYQRWWRICREIIFFLDFIIACFTFLYPFVKYFPTIPRMILNRRKMLT